MKRHVVLPARGTLLISTDLHGNGQDFRALEQIFHATSVQDPETHWVILGDTVHGPDERARRSRPALYDYPDESITIVEGILRLMAQAPGRVHYVLGNHDYGHVGGPHTAKFYPDEVTQLEASLDAAQRGRLKQLFEPALLAAAAPCGLLMTHGAPGGRLQRLSELDGIALPPAPEDLESRKLIDGVLTAYGQPPGTIERLLETLSQPGLALGVAVHGHDRDENGWYVEGEHSLCPVIFGAPRANKRYLRVDLAGQYRNVADLVEGREILRVYESVVLGENGGG